MGNINIIKSFVASFALAGLLSSCSTLEEASVHGFNSGYYKVESGKDPLQKVYVDVTEEKIEVYRLKNHLPDKADITTIPLLPSDSLKFEPAIFKKNSLDIDITTVLLKYRPPSGDLPAQMITDFNVALFAGWRHDTYSVTGKMNPLGTRYPKIKSRGYDFGVFAGPGATSVNAATTRNKITDEYNGVIIQTGVAGFLETNVASFGIAVGFDYLLNDDRRVWIYDNKPWAGFIVGIALN
jgi:hypothetical protein